MEQKEIPVLSDPHISPSDDLIFSLISDKKSLWLSLIDHVSANYEGFKGEWNYYNDGKSWLYKMVRKNKTLFWIGLTGNTFRVTFYFSDKAEKLINESSLPEKIKADFSTSKRYGAIRGISIIMSGKSDLDNVIILAGIRKKVL